MKELIASSPQLPLPLLGLIALSSFAVLLLSLRQVTGLAAVFLLVAVWLRVVSGAFNKITFAPLVGGLSFNAILSVMTVMIGIMLVPKGNFRERWVLPIYILIAVVLVSGLYNRTFSGLIDTTFKWGYVIVMIAAARRAIEDNGPAKTFKFLLYCYAPLFVCQLFTIALGMPKQGELDGSASYIGGYYHEATFSVMVMTFIALVYLARTLPFSVRAGLLLMGAASMFLANYRTAILAAMPLMLGFGVLAGLSRITRRQREILVLMLVPALFFGLAFALTSEGVQARFADLARTLSSPGDFIKPPREYTLTDEKILSGRLKIWSHYISAYVDARAERLLIGFGPNSWNGVFTKYAHNTVVSFIYEFGAIGVLALLYIWLSFVLGTFRVRDPIMRSQLLLAQLSFFLLNMATMPHWQIEGNIMFALIQATLLVELGREARGRSLARAVASPAFYAPSGSAPLDARAAG